ncbi:MAG TPA: nucleotidyltransferase family protein [Stenomitos sp.]
MERDLVIAILHRHQESLKELGVKSLSIFGSVARNEAHSQSDIDILVEFAEPPSFDRYMDLKLYLEDSLGKNVDLLSRLMLKPQIRKTVGEEAIVCIEMLRHPMADPLKIER